MDPESNDTKLWTDFKKGDEYALSNLYYSYADKLFRYGKKFSSDDDLVKDTIQDLFYDLIRTRDTLGSTDHIYFYLIKAFRRRLLHSRLEKKNLRLSEQEIDGRSVNIVYSIEDEWIMKESLTRKEEIVRRGLCELSQKQREILYYKFTCEFEYDQICEIMSIKYDSARKMVFRSLKTLREHLSETNFTFLYLHRKHITFF